MKAKYKLSNWSSYNRSLMERTKLTVWIDPKAIKSWKNKNGQTGAAICVCRWDDIAIFAAQAGISSSFTADAGLFA